MSTLSTSDVMELEARLRAARDDVLGAIHLSLHGRNADEQAALFAYFAAGAGQPDAGVLAALDLPLIERQVRELKAIDAALKRIDYGVVGICVECGVCIQLERLRAIPTAQTCASCQERLDAGRAMQPAAGTLAPHRPDA